MNEYYGNNDWRDYLAHYGVKGMKWRNHKYLRKLGDFYEYNITGKGYLKDADRLKKKALGYGTVQGGAKGNRQRRLENAATRAYANYQTKSLKGRYNGMANGSDPKSIDYINAIKTNRYSNLSEMHKTKNELKKRQAKEKAKALIDKVLGRNYKNSTPGVLRSNKEQMASDKLKFELSKKRGSAKSADIALNRVSRKIGGVINSPRFYISKDKARWGKKKTR